MARENGKQKSIAQQAVAIFMVGTLDEARSILEIGQAIVEQRAMGAGPAAVAVANQPVRRRGPGRPRVNPPAASGPVLVPPQAPSPTGQVVAPATTAITPPVRRRRRPPVTAIPQTSNMPIDPVTPTTVGGTELPPQGDPDVDEV